MRSIDRSATDNRRKEVKVKENEIKEENNRNRRGSRSIVGDAKRGSSGTGGRRTLGRDFGSCCEEGGFASRRGRSPGYPRKRSRRWVRARRGGWRRRWWSPGTPRRRSEGGEDGGDGEVLAAARARAVSRRGVRRPDAATRRRAGGAAANRRPGGRDAEWARRDRGEGYGLARRALL
ncbi:hypothetical protein GQ55_4G351100 [Panicum hallii var. hallii]|uniref:Uncharacterized protein n=1 Tax=Panicum hallii var. hallii TaxID=1504633 RepID=A0A2T7E3F0_9POAL|nr:hypothetical protein GQ55_4G351100 [Panicum hallii var. hallii]